MKLTVIDNFLDSKTLSDVMFHCFDLKDWNLVDRHKKTKKKEKVLPTDLVDRIRDTYYKQVKIEELSNKALSFSASVIKCDPGYMYPMHADQERKIISSVVYLDPINNYGTIFESSGEVKWKPNRLVTWLNQGELHWYRNNSLWDNRYTMNIYITEGKRNFVVETSGTSNTEK